MIAQVHPDHLHGVHGISNPSLLQVSLSGNKLHKRGFLSSFWARQHSLLYWSNIISSKQSHI
jgi:hypothetical protein